MARLLRAVLQAASTSVSPQAFDVAGETRTPKAAAYEISSCVTLGTAAAVYRYGSGITEGTNQRAHCAFAENGALSNVADSGGRTDDASVVLITNATSTVLNGEGNFSAFHAGGSDIAWSNFPGSAFQTKALYFMEGDWDVVEVTNLGAANTSDTISGLSYTPDFVYAISQFDGFPADTAHDVVGRISFGYAIKTPAGAIQQVAFTDTIDDNATPTTCASSLRDDCVVSRHTAGADGPRFSVTAWHADGLTLTKHNSSDPLNAAFLIGRTGRRMWCGVPTLVTSSTGNKTISDPGMVPEAYILIATDLAAKNSRATDASASKWSHGVYTGEESACIGVQAENAAVTSDTRSMAAASIANVVDDAGGTSWAASHVGMGPSGPIINIDDASAADRVVGLVTIAGVEAPGFLVQLRKWRRQLARM